ncbi:glycosyltransferase [Arthrobacter crystallopoietes]|uniref:glycosyltransferase n=1 Tax=Crystallibacter crystallopoietes TaxID=37928 RepID=UPI001ABE9D80|nr:glycosyltransferase [Arthrobacter crystallopoietes]QTG79516.1 glycosyltransferase [Arthrobacter crystallopoietes]
MEIDCVVAAGTPDATQALRGDQETPTWVETFDNRRIPVGGRSLILGGARPLWHRADAVIVGLQGSSLDTYKAILDGKRRKVRVGLWGHIKTFVQPENAIDAALERWQIRHADHIFAYTPDGGEYARKVGATAVTTVMNTVDTTKLEEALQTVTDNDVARVTGSMGVHPGKTLAFFGGIDESKRIDFLSDVLDILWRLDPEIRLLIGGEGAQSSLLKFAVARGQVTMLGYVNEQQKALVSKVADCIVMPGRIGLVAVEALVLQLPIITTQWPYHAPEESYLEEGKSKITAENTPTAYASKIVEFLDGLSQKPASGSVDRWAYPSIDRMVSNYTNGVLSLLS